MKHIFTPVQKQQILNFFDNYIVLISKYLESILLVEVVFVRGKSETGKVFLSTYFYWTSSNIGE